ncbi:hypothetical protein Tco_1197037, partial [Tanacetum coccineum]
TDKTKITRKLSKRANTDTRNGRAQKKPGNQVKVKVNTRRQNLKSSNPIFQVSKVTQMVLESYTSSYSPHWSITSKNDTLAGVEAQRMMGFVLKALTEVAQMSQSRIATLAIRVRSFGDLTDENHYPIIGRIQGMI